MADEQIIFEGSTARLVVGKKVVATSVFHVTSDGIFQIVELTTGPKYLRKGHASKLLTAMVKKLRPRKMWIAVGHKSQVIGRAFLTRHGFHHISTTSNLLGDEDLLIYVKSWV
jgi:ribosomal protein S18 acetylase RimI-like enzyme